MENLKYEYYLYTWGGFYNEEYKNVHNEEKGAKWFNTFEERDQYIDKLKNIEKELNAKHLMMVRCEGYFTRIPVKIHRVSRYKDEYKYTSDEFWPDYGYDAAKYHLEYKWYPGFNDYPFGENFDYSIRNKEFEIVKEWISGCFEYKINE